MPANDLKKQAGAWPWSQTSPDRGEFTRDGGRCRLWATKIQRAIGGHVIRIAPNPARVGSASLIGPVRMTDGTLITNEFHEHFAFRKGDRIFDRITGPVGLPFREYRKLFDFADDLTFSECEEEP